MSMTIKVLVSTIEGASICEKVEDSLFNDSKNAYTVSGLMVEVFGVNKTLIQNKPFKEWGEDPKVGKLPTLYSRIRKCLEGLVENKHLLKKRVGKKDLYWWNPVIKIRNIPE